MRRTLTALGIALIFLAAAVVVSPASTTPDSIDSKTEQTQSDTNEREAPAFSFASHEPIRSLTRSFTPDVTLLERYEERQQDTSTDSGEMLTPDEKELKEYGNAAGEILIEHIALAADSAALDNALVFGTTTPDTLVRDGSALIPVAKRYRDIGERIGALERPQAVIDAALDFAQSAFLISDALEMLAATEGQERAAQQEALTYYNETVIEWAKTYQTLTLLFRQANISFEPYEPGRVFTQ